MKTLDRYILRQLVVVLLLVLLSLTLLAWFTQVIKLLDIIVEKGRSLGEFFGITFLLLPLLMGLITPFAMFVASVFVLDRLNRDSELVVIGASGVSRWRLLRPFAVVGVFAMGLVVAVNLYIQPLTMHAYRDKLSSISADLIAILVEEGRFSSPQHGVMVHVRDVAPGGVLNGILLEDARDPKQPVTYFARRAVLLDGGLTPHLLLEDGTVLTGDPTDHRINLVHFEQYSLSMGNLLEDEQDATLRPSDLFISDLLTSSQEELSDAQRRTLSAEFHNRLTTPLYVFVLILVAFVVLSEARTTRRERIFTIIGVTAIAAAIRVGGFVANNLAVSGKAPMVTMYAIPLAVGVVAAIIISHQSGRRPRAQAPAPPGSGPYAVAR